MSKDLTPRKSFEVAKASGGTRGQMYRVGDFKNWNMYKNYLAHKGNLSHNLDYNIVDWAGYLRASGKTPD